MRVFFIALLIALLPVRGWVGDAMAISMAGLPDGQPAMVVKAVADAGHDHHAGMDHGDHADDDMATADAHSHSACDVCNGPVLTVSDTSPALVRAVHALHADRVEAFASSLPRAGHKPPIS